MNVTQLKLVTLLLVLAGAVLANPPPGALLGQTVAFPVWAAAMGLAALGGLASVVRGGGRTGRVGAGLLAVALLGDLTPFGGERWFALAVAAWAYALHLELLSFATRKRRWSRLLGDDAEGIVTYERAYVGAFLKLAGATAAGIALLAGAYAALIAVGPSTFSLSLEARQVEAFAAFVLLLGGLAAALRLLLARARPPTDEPEALP